jgi:hypothetical protein
VAESEFVPANLSTGTDVLPYKCKSRKKAARSALNGRMNTPAETASNVAESDPARLKEIKAHLAEDVRPLVAHLAEDVRPLVGRLNAVPEVARPLLERARPWVDPIVDEMRPIINDLRPVVQELRADLAERLARFVSAATQFTARIDPGSVTALGEIAGANARRLASMRPTPRVAGPRPSVARAVRAPRVSTGPRLPSMPIGAALRSLARRLRPGRWAFRTLAISLIALVVGTPSLQQAMVAEINWSRSVLQTIEMPTVELPTLEMPTIELPTIELPAIQIPAFEMPTFQLPGGESAAASKLVPAQFELPPLNAYRATFQTQASYPTVPPNATVEWVVALRNTGSAGWYRGVAGAQAALALTDGTQVAVQTTEYVAPGQVGWFIARFRAPAGPGTHTVALFPRIDGRGELPDLGIFAVVTVR